MELFVQMKMFLFTLKKSLLVVTFRIIYLLNQPNHFLQCNSYMDSYIDERIVGQMNGHIERLIDEQIGL